MSKIIVLHIVGGMNRAGAETYLMNMYRCSDRDKFAYKFVCYGNREYDYEQEILDLGGAIIRVSDIKKVGAIRVIRQLRKVMIDEEAQIVHAHTHYNSAFSLIAAKLAGVKIRITHSHTAPPISKFNLIRSMYYFASKFVINTLSTIRLACSNQAGLALFGSKKFMVITNGIILDDFKYSTKLRSKLRRKMHINHSATVIGHVGRYESVKNHSFLIDIFEEYIKFNDNAQLLLIGNGILKERMIEKVALRGLASKVIFMEGRGNVNELYNVMDIFVFPSLFEGLGIVLVESQANGLACFASTGVPKEVKLNSNLFFESIDKSAGQWAERIHKQPRKRLDINIQNKIANYDAGKSADKLSSIYRDSVMKNHQNPAQEPRDD